MVAAGNERSERQLQSQRVYEALRQMILDWKLPPGTPLSESDLSRQLGGSRTPVRQAIQQLTHEGLVRSMPGRGAFVAEISFRDIVELYEMREVLEAGAARLAARSAQRDTLAALEPEFDGFRKLLNSTNNAAYYDLIQRFDTAILQLCGNQRMIQSLQEIWSQVDRLRHIAATDPNRLGETVDEHLQILRAIVSGDEQKAAECVHEHVRKSAQNVMRNLTDRTSQRYITM